MLFPIHIGEKLDLSKFRKQAAHYIGQMQELTYHFYLPDYKAVINIITPIGRTNHLVNVTLYELWRDTANEIIRTTPIVPFLDLRFSESKIIQSIFTK